MKTTLNELEVLLSIINNDYQTFDKSDKALIESATWVLAFNVDKSQHKEKLESMFEIRLFNDDNKNRYVINITNEAYKFHQWNDVIHKLEKEIKKYYL
jgi:hypothetical protein